MTTSVEKIQGFSKQQLINSLSNEQFQLILFPTEQCNFRCVYCYEDFEIGKMPDWLIEATKKLISNKLPKLSKFHFSWFGGEPLLAKDVVFNIAEYTFNLAKQLNCDVSGDMTTNGLLLDIKTLEKLISLKQNSFQISIDGDKESHDKTRVTRTGRGSFDKIWQRLLDAANTDLKFSITLRVHVTDLNQDSVLDFCNRYDKFLAEDSRFKLFFKAIEDLGGNNKVDVNSLTSQKSATELVSQLTTSYSDQSVKLGSKGNYICYAGKPNSLSIRANGNLNKCTVALNDDRNSIGKINKDGSLDINNQRFSSWVQGFSTLDSWQMGCPLSYMNHHNSVGDIQFKKVG
ncbi:MULTISPECIES: radical SAM protein [unclassified Pseudoalteromonas]|uniref:radical SAM protein n=1 Tax=unclassified Pseudoalteromonas TaxID=194690 RepID=UPI0005A9135F|nr:MULTISPECIES: radical SAM protein [unclassified Pseudoalteromonas]